MMLSRATGRHRRRGTALVAALAALLALGGCKSVTGRILLPVYGDAEPVSHTTAGAPGRVTVHFTADCVAAGRGEPLVRLRYVDTVADVRFDAEGFAPLCSHYDTFYGMYGEYVGVYYPDVDLDPSGRRGEGQFQLEIVDGGMPGYSEEDYVCFRLIGGAFARYRLPAWHDVTGDGRRDEGCAYLGGGTIQINLDSTVPWS